MTNPIPQPKQGQQVLWMAPPSEDGNVPSKPYPAFITQVLTPYNVSLFVMQQVATESLVNVSYDENKSAGTWHFIPPEV